VTEKSQEEILAEIADLELRQRELQRTHKLLFFRPAVPLTNFFADANPEILIQGGNQSGKTATGCVDHIVSASGIIPYALRDTYNRAKFQGSGNLRYRFVGPNFGEWFDQVIKPSLQEWIPPEAYYYGSWDKSYKERPSRHLVLRRTHINPQATVTIFFMSFEQDVRAHGGPVIHRIWFDEPGPPDLLAENQARQIHVAPSFFLHTMTPIKQGGGLATNERYIFELFEPAMSGADPERSVYHLRTEDNPIAQKEQVESVFGRMDSSQVAARRGGAFTHLSNLVYPDFARVARAWCFGCAWDDPNAGHVVTRTTDDGTTVCNHCSSRVALYTNVVPDQPVPKSYPVIQVVDPHPRTPTAVIYAAVDEWLNAYIFDYLWVEGTIDTIRAQMVAAERGHHRRPSLRIMDREAFKQGDNRLYPGMTTVREFEKDARFRFAPSMSDWDHGFNVLTTMLRPAALTSQPQIVVFESCGIPKGEEKFGTPIYQMTHHVYREWVRPSMQKTSPEDVEQRYKHFCDDLRYLAAWLEKGSYEQLLHGPATLRAVERLPLAAARQRKARVEKAKSHPLVLSHLRNRPGRAD